MGITASPLTFPSATPSTSSRLIGFVNVLSATFSPLIGSDALGRDVSLLTGLEDFSGMIAAALPGWTQFWWVGSALSRTLTVNCDESFGSALGW